MRVRERNCVCAMTVCVSGSEIERFRSALHATGKAALTDQKACVHISATPGGLTITGAGRNAAIRCRVPVQVLAPGAISVGVGAICRAADMIGSEKQVKLHEDGEALNMKFGASRLRFVREYAMPPALTPPVGGWRPAKDLVDAVMRCAFATARGGDAAHLLTGVRIQNGSALATDRFRMVTMPVATEHGNLVIPGEISRIMPEALRTAEANPQYAVANGMVYLQVEGVMLAAQLLRGQYPAAERAIPDAWAASQRLDANALVSALQQAVVVCEGPPYPVALVPRRGGQIMEVYSESSMVGSCRTTVPVLGRTGRPSAVLLNGATLLEGIKALRPKWCMTLRTNPDVCGLVQWEGDSAVGTPVTYYAMELTRAEETSPGQTA